MFATPSCKETLYYSFAHAGDGLAPRFFDGDELFIDPEPQVVSRGDAVLAEVRTRRANGRQCTRATVYIIGNKDSLIDLKGARIPPGEYEIVGLVIGWNIFNNNG